MSEAPEENSQLEIANRQSPVERLADQSYVLLIVALCILANIEFWLTLESPLTPPPIIVGSVPLLSAIWHLLFAAFAVLVLWGLGGNHRRYEAAGHVCLIMGVLIQAASIAVFKFPTEGEITAIAIDMFAALMAGARVWSLRRPLRADIVVRNPNGNIAPDPPYGSHADRTSRPGAGTESPE